MGTAASFHQSTRKALKKAKYSQDCDQIRDAIRQAELWSCPAKWSKEDTALLELCRDRYTDLRDEARQRLQAAIAGTDHIEMHAAILRANECRVDPALQQKGRDRMTELSQTAVRRLAHSLSSCHEYNDFPELVSSAQAFVECFDDKAALLVDPVAGALAGCSGIYSRSGRENNGRPKYMQMGGGGVMYHSGSSWKLGFGDDTTQYIFSITSWSDHPIPGAWRRNKAFKPPDGTVLTDAASQITVRFAVATALERVGRLKQVATVYPAPPPFERELPGTLVSRAVPGQPRPPTPEPAKATPAKASPVKAALAKATPTKATPVLAITAGEAAPANATPVRATPVLAITAGETHDAG